jgi:hypothetical protein
VIKPLINEFDIQCAAANVAGIDGYKFRLEQYEKEVEILTNTFKNIENIYKQGIEKLKKKYKIRD